MLVWLSLDSYPKIPTTHNGGSHGPMVRELHLWAEGCRFDSESRQVTTDVPLNNAPKPL